MKATRRNFLLIAASVAAMTLWATPAIAAETTIIARVTPPSVHGAARYLNTLSASAGVWRPDDVSLAYQWLRNGVAVRGATKKTYKLGKYDINRRLRVRVTAKRPGTPAVAALSAQTAKVAPARIRNIRRPRIRGSLKYTKTVRGSAGTWSTKGLKFSYQWTRNKRAIPRATQKKYKLAAADVGKRLRVVVRASKPGYSTAKISSVRKGPIRHLKATKRTVKYRVVTRGHIKTSLKTFRSLANATLNDPRGWPLSGVVFKEVKTGGSMTLVLSQASKVPSFSSGCSSTYSCRVGRYVIINQDRWRKATPSWNHAKGSLRNYRHMVVNHETGHWLGHGHRMCGRRGALAPVMAQQSISLGGCTFNSWPKASERHVPRFNIG